jgi:hypothetical protein
MTALRCCTLTGVDEQTDLNALKNLSRKFPRAEWGVLWSGNQQEKHQGAGRYPRAQWIKEFGKATEGRKIMTALHICGDDALSFLRGDTALWEVAQLFNRVQLNVKAQGTSLAQDLDEQTISRAAHMFTFSYGHGRIIFQLNNDNKQLCERVRSNGIDMLFDSSLGRGVLPASWPNKRDFPGMRIGYAGGLGPDNIQEQLPFMSKACAGSSFWVDMESKLRTNDRFDLGACETVLRAAHWHVLESQISQGEIATKDPELGFSTDPALLKGIGLDWWAGMAAGYAMNPPEKNSCRAMSFNRFDGDHSGFSPSENANDFQELVEDTDVGCIKRSGQWFGVTSEGEEVKGSSRNDAMLRATIVESFGTRSSWFAGRAKR